MPYHEYWHIEMLQDFEEVIDTETGLRSTVISLKSKLVFDKSAEIIEKPLMKGYDKDLISIFNKYMLPMIGDWLKNTLGPVEHKPREFKSGCKLL